MDIRDQLKNDVTRFQELTGLGDHRVGIILVRGGKFVERLRRGGRFYPETIEAANAGLVREILARELDQSGFFCLKPVSQSSTAESEAAE